MAKKIDLETALRLIDAAKKKASRDQGSHEYRVVDEEIIWWPLSGWTALAGIHQHRPEQSLHRPGLQYGNKTLAP
jgi:hypothetical protein